MIFRGSRLLGVLMLLAMVPLCTIAKQKISKKEKVILKSLKKQYELEDAEFVRVEPDFKFIRLELKDHTLMAADSTGNLLFPKSAVNSNSFHSIVCYQNREVGAGYVFQINRNTGNNVLTEFYNQDGKLINVVAGTTKRATADFYIVTAANGLKGVVSQTGCEIIPEEYSTISIRSNGICMLTQEYDGLLLHGGLSLTNREIENVPCRFNSVQWDERARCWMVKVHSFNDIEPFNSTMDYDTTFKDEGQRLYELGRYEDVRRYYEVENTTAPWRQFFVGASFYHEAVSSRISALNGLELIEKSSNEDDRNTINTIEMDMAGADVLIDKALSTLVPLKEQDSEYQRSISEMNYQLSEMQLRAPSLKVRLETAVRGYNGRIENIRFNRAEAERLQRENRIRQKMITDKMIRENNRRMLEAKRKAANSNKSSQTTNMVTHHKNLSQPTSKPKSQIDNKNTEKKLGTRQITGFKKKEPSNILTK